MLPAPASPAPRRLRPADATAVAALIRAAFAALPVAPAPPMSALRITAEDVAGHLVTGGGAVVQAGERLVGCALWVPREGGLYVGRVAVAPEWRRRGIARALIAAAEAAAREAGWPRLHLSTRLVLTDNRRLFASCGFIETARHAHPGYAAPTYVDMEKWLDGTAQAHRSARVAQQAERSRGPEAAAAGCGPRARPL